MRELPTYTPDFEEYIRQGEPGKKERAQIWRTAIGLQQVDGLETSDYLKQTVRRNIEGEISIDEVQRLVKAYYVSKTNREPDDDDKQEADNATANIGKILASRTFDFSTNGYISLHKRIFAGVFKHAGHIRDYDITKKEFVLRGSTVYYMNWEDLRRALDYDINQEKQFSYKGLSQDEVIAHLAKFVADLWQIHAFCEGNTRTTAVFTIQYLRFLGYDVNNDMFAANSWYFRNALVRANYKNVQQGIEYSPIYLERFFRNLLLGEQWELKSRYLVINPPAEYTEQPRHDVGINSADVGKSTLKGTMKGILQSATQSAIQSANLEDDVLSKCKNCTLKELAVLRVIQQNPSATQKQIAEQIRKSERTVKTITVSLGKKGLIVRRKGKRDGHWEVLPPQVPPQAPPQAPPQVPPQV